MYEAQLVEYHRVLDEANIRIESGRFLSQEDLEEGYQQWEANEYFKSIE